MASNLFGCMDCSCMRLYSLFSLYFPCSLSSWSGFLFHWSSSAIILDYTTWLVYGGRKSDPGHTKLPLQRLVDYEKYPYVCNCFCRFAPPPFSSPSPHVPIAWHVFILQDMCNYFRRHVTTTYYIYRQKSRMHTFFCEHFLTSNMTTLSWQIQGIVSVHKL